MKTLILAAATVLSFGVGFAHAADSGEDGGIIANTFFTTLPGVIAIAPGPQTDAVAANQHNAPAAAYRTVRAVSPPQLR